MHSGCFEHRWVHSGTVPSPALQHPAGQTHVPRLLVGTVDEKPLWSPFLGCGLERVPGCSVTCRAQLRCHAASREPTQTRPRSPRVEPSAPALLRHAAPMATRIPDRRPERHWPDASRTEPCSHSVTRYQRTGPVLPACPSAAWGLQPRTGAVHPPGTAPSRQPHPAHTPGSAPTCQPCAVQMEGFWGGWRCSHPSCQPLQHALVGH